jgi:hypothetical protein
MSARLDWVFVRESLSLVYRALSARSAMDIAGARRRCRIFTAFGGWDGSEESIGSAMMDYTLCKYAWEW